MSIAYSVSGNFKVITVTGTYTGTLADALTNMTGGAFDPAANDLKIVGAAANQVSTWNDFQYSYSNGQPTNLHIENITFFTTTVNGYCIYSKVTNLTMTNVTIDGYSGGQNRWTETAGGALRLRGATYSPAHDTNTPTLNNITVTNCCRGLRVQDSVGVYVKDCDIVKANGASYSVSDNALYFAAGDYTSATGCSNCTFDGCDVEGAGQVAFMSIGGSNNTFLNCTMDTSTGAGFGCYNATGTINVTGCSFTNANTALANEVNGWGGSVDNFSGAACGVNVAVTDYTANVLVSGCTFVSGGNIVYSKVGAGAMTTTNDTVTLGAFTGGLGSWLSYSTDGNFKAITVNNNYSGTLAAALPLTGGTFTTSTDNDLKIIGAGSGVVWNDFQYSYSDGQPEYIHIENIKFLTTTVNGYCIYSKVTKLTMTDVTIDGYSGGEGRWTETSGGALRLRGATYTGHDTMTPTLNTITVTNCCRGLRIQDSVGVYVRDCDIVKAAGASYSVSDNALYFASGDYKSSAGCTNCTFEGCTVEGAGQVAFMSIGGSSNTFLNCTMDTSTGAGFGCFNTNGAINVTGCSFTNANTALANEVNGWGGSVDNFGTAACGMNVETGDTSANVIVSGCSFVSGSGVVFYKSTTVGIMTRSTNTVTIANFTGWGVGFVPPVLTQVTDITTPWNTNTTPSYVFDTDTVGTITSSLGFSSSTSSIVGNNTITFNALAETTYSGSTVTVTDTSQNLNTTSLTIPDFIVDITSPTIAITAAEVASGATSNNATLSLTFTSSKTTTNFVVGDITVTNGTISDFAGSGTTYTATFTPTTEAACTIEVLAGAFTNGTNDNNYASSQFKWTFDLIPTLSLVSIVSNNPTTTLAKLGNIVTLTTTVSEAVSAFGIVFTIGGAAIAGAAPTVTNTSGTTTWTAVYTPVTGDTDGVVGFTVSFTDVGGKVGIPVTTVTDGTGVTFDKTLPTVSSFVMDDVALKRGDTASVALTFSEAVPGFDSGSYITVATGTGTLETMTSNAQNMVWTGVFTPTDAIEVLTNVLILTSGYTDVAGNASTHAAIQTLNYAIDTLQPVTASVTPITFNGTTNVISRTPSFVFSATEVGTITTSGATFSTATAAVVGNNTITFEQLADYTTFSAITIIVTDTAGNPSTALIVPTFTVDTTTSNTDVITTVSNHTTFTNTLTAIGANQTGKTVELHATTNPHASYKARITLPNGDFTNLTLANKNSIKAMVRDLYATELGIVAGDTIYVDLAEGSIIIDVYVLTTTAVSSNISICFPKGTPVTTNQGEIAIEKLRPGFHTIRGKKITAITCTQPDTTHIIRIKKNALGKNVPCASTHISNHHRVFYKGHMVKASDLVNMCEGVVTTSYGGEVLYNVVMKKHDKMMINNLICETLHPDNIMARICADDYTHREKVELCAMLKRIGKTNDFTAYNNLYASLK
jgi:hypothetical protein